MAGLMSFNSGIERRWKTEIMSILDYTYFSKIHRTTIVIFLIQFRNFNVIILFRLRKSKRSVWMRFDMTFLMRHSLCQVLSTIRVQPTKYCRDRLKTAIFSQYPHEKSRRVRIGTPFVSLACAQLRRFELLVSLDALSVFQTGPPR
jgi:hypothetical protein